MYKDDLALDNQQQLICHKTQTNQSDKTEFMCFSQDGAILLNDKPLKLMHQFIFETQLTKQL